MVAVPAAALEHPLWRSVPPRRWRRGVVVGILGRRWRRCVVPKGLCRCLLVWLKCLKMWMVWMRVVGLRWWHRRHRAVDEAVQHRDARVRRRNRVGGEDVWRVRVLEGWRRRGVAALAGRHRLAHVDRRRLRALGPGGAFRLGPLGATPKGHGEAVRGPLRRERAHELRRQLLQNVRPKRLHIANLAFAGLELVGVRLLRSSSRPACSLAVSRKVDSRLLLFCNSAASRSTSAL